MATDPDNLKLSREQQQRLDTTPVADRQSQLEALLDQLHFNDSGIHPLGAVELIKLHLDIAALELDLDLKTQAYERARQTIQPCIEHMQFELAALACQYIYLCERDDSIAAIGQAAWLAVTYPVDPNLTVAILDHIIDETPDNSDGAAVAAAAAHYVVDIRAEGNEHEKLRLFTGAMLARVARRHSNIDNQQMFELWVERLELDVPDKFLIRLRNVVDVMVQDDWWFDRQALTNELPA
ncbi:hypothetical protein AB833_08625 [Chromatiales bacterium (ex Bugula neritina AB1)]|nr:hypothetical protein AB833_08625 [Chromatiales bacterium (ex Bugula neritina AB1)]